MDSTLNRKCMRAQVRVRNINITPTDNPGPSTTDINECEVWKDQVCARHQVCVNTQGSYACEYAIKCPQGFENDPFTGECQGCDNMNKNKNQ